jgi:hypothetical protein
MRAKYIAIGVILGVLLLSAVVVLAGDLEPPAEPMEPDSQMYTLEQIYDRLKGGEAATMMTEFTEPSSGPGTTMHTLNDIMDTAPEADDANAAGPGDVLGGKTYWGLSTEEGAWGPQAGTAAEGSDVSGPEGFRMFTIPNGFYFGSRQATANDSDLVAGNVKQGVTLFGVNGTLSGGCTCTGTVMAT